MISKKSLTISQVHIENIRAFYRLFSAYPIERIYAYCFELIARKDLENYDFDHIFDIFAEKYNKGDSL